MLQPVEHSGEGEQYHVPLAAPPSGSCSPCRTRRQPLAAALERNQPLQTPNLQNPWIGAEGAKSLAAALERHQTLQTLNPGYNSIGDEGVKSFAAVLARNSTLQTLDLWHNGIR